MVHVQNTIQIKKHRFFTVEACMLTISSLLFIQLMHNNIAPNECQNLHSIYIKMFLHVSV